MPFLANGSIILSKPVGAPVIPWHGDHVLGQAGNRVGIGVADIAPEEQAAIERRERIVNLLEEIDIDRSVSLLLRPHRCVRPTPRSKVSSAPMWMKGEGNSCAICVNQSLMSGSVPRLTGREHIAVRSLRQILVKLVFEHVVQMAEGLLLGHDGDVILARVGDQFRDLRGRERAARRRGQRMIGIEQRVLEIGRVDIDLEGSEDANLVLLEVERGKRAAREIVVDAAISHRRPVAHRAGGQHARRAGQAAATA